GHPLAMGLKVQLILKPLLVNFRRSTGSDPRLPNKLFSAVAENKPVGFYPVIEFTLPVELRIFHLEEVGEIRRCLDPDNLIHWFIRMIRDSQVLVKTTSNRTLPHDG